MKNWTREGWQRCLGVLIVVVSFLASAGATIDWALGEGVHPWTSAILPVSLELSIVLATLVWIGGGAKVELARVVFWAFVTVTWLVNFAHAGGGIAGALAAMPTLSLPAGLHLAFDMPHRKATKRSTTKRASAPSKPKAPSSTPKAVPASTNGHRLTTGKITAEKLREMFNSTEAVESWYAEYKATVPGATWHKAWASIGATPKQGWYLRKVLAEEGR